MRSPAKRVWMVLVAITLLIVGGSVALIIPPDQAPATPLPNPNGYDDFVKAGELLVVDASRYPDTSLENLQTMVASNAAALALLREGLNKESRVPLQFTQQESSDWVSEITGFKALGHALTAEARCQSLEGNPGEAAITCVETVQLGVESCRGGVLIHRMVGTAIEGIGFQTLGPIFQKLDAAESRQTVQKLDEILSSREPLADVVGREQLWSRSVSGIKDLVAAVMLTRSLRPAKAMTAPAFAKCEQQETVLDQQLLNMAAHAYELENGHTPESTADLVPDYLKAIPVDSATGSPLQIQ